MTGVVDERDTVGFAGYQLSRRPVGLVLRARSRWRWGQAYTVFGSIESDIAATAGTLRHLTYAAVSLGPFGLAPTVRRRAESGDLSVSPQGAAGMIADLGSEAGRGALEGHCSLVRRGVRPASTGPRRIGGTVFLHVPFANPDTGYAWGYGAGLDHLYASAAETLVVSYDVSVDTPPALPNSFVIAPDTIGELVHLPYGAFPSSSWPLYRVAAPFLAEYARHGKDPAWARDLPSTPVDLVNEHLVRRDRQAMTLRICPESGWLLRTCGLS